MLLVFWLSIVLVSLSAFVFILIPAPSPSVMTNGNLSNKFKYSNLLVAAILSVLTIATYHTIGTPSLVETKKVAVIEDEYTNIITRVEAHLEENPDDIEGWQVLAPAYLSRNQPKKAFQAFANAIKLGNSNGANWLGLGKANLADNNGVFGPMSKVAFSKAHEKSPQSIEAMVFYASYLADAKQFDEAEQKIDDFIKDSKHSPDALKSLVKIKALIKADRE